MEKARKGKYAHIKSKVDAQQDKKVMELTKAKCENVVKTPRLEKGGKSKSGSSHADEHSHEHGHGHGPSPRKSKDAHGHEHGHEHGSKENRAQHGHGNGDGGKSPRNSKDH